MTEQLINEFVFRLFDMIYSVLDDKHMLKHANSFLDVFCFFYSGPDEPVITIFRCLTTFSILNETCSFLSNIYSLQKKNFTHKFEKLDIIQYFCWGLTSYYAEHHWLVCNFSHFTLQFSNDCWVSIILVTYQHNLQQLCKMHYRKLNIKFVGHKKGCTMTV